MQLHLEPLYITFCPSGSVLGRNTFLSEVICMRSQRRTCTGIAVTVVVLSIAVPVSSAVELARDYHVRPIAFSSVHVKDQFWTPRLETNRTVTIPCAFEKCVETGRIMNFEKAAGLVAGEHEGFYFNDSDLYKVMEAAAYSLQVHPDRMIRLYLDQLIRIIAGAQWEDGYLFTFYSVPDRQPEKLWTDMQNKHELYCAGHMYEAAVAHHLVTGSESFLDVATANADLICDTFAPGKRTDPPGHEEIEIGLCKLYRVTGDIKYLNQAKFLLDQRGRVGNRGPDGNRGLYGIHFQDHKPVTKQSGGVGHAVRAAYLYTGMADVAALTGNREYVHAIDTIWNDVTSTKLYITGGAGVPHESFGDPYELPNMTAYCETCASIANILWNHRMFLMHADAKYIDVLERSLYNAALSGVSMTGDRFFYPNALESIGQHERRPWFGCACCPSNVARFIPSVPGYAYAHKNDDIYVNLYMGGQADIETPDNKVTLTQKTDYPRSGRVRIIVAPEKSQRFTIHVRIPGWARNEPIPSDLYTFQKVVNEPVRLQVNGQRISANGEKGYVHIKRRWRKGDRIELNFPMPVRRILTHQRVESNWGKVALQRGPLVYCLEWPDNDGEVLNRVLADDVTFQTEFRPDLLNGVTVISGQSDLTRRELDGTIIAEDTRPFTAIPYYAWAHRGRGQMTVWPARRIETTRPQPAETLAHLSKTTASFRRVSLDAIKDQVVPANSADTSALHLDFRPHKGTTEWLLFEWDDMQALSSVKVYWYDDSGRGDARVPKSWKALYRDAQGAFQPVQNHNPYGTDIDKFNQVEFTPVSTHALKIEITLEEKWTSGVQEVVIE